MNLTVSPQSFNVGQSETGQTTSRLLLANQGGQPAVVALHAKDWPGLITLNPDQFVLQPGQTQTIDVQFSTLPAGNAETLIIAQARELGASTSVDPYELQVPVHIAVREQAHSLNPVAWVVFLALLIAGLALAAYARASQLKFALASVFNRFRLRFDAWITRQPTLKPYIVATSIIGIVLVGALLVWGLRPTTEQTPAGMANANGLYEYQVALTTPSLHQLFAIETDQPQTAFSALQKVSEQYTIPLQFQRSDMGVFVTAIAGATNGSDGCYWIYEINGQKVPIASDAYQLQPQDQLVWKFTIPE